jgi:hypothetical protein
MAQLPGAQRLAGRDAVGTSRTVLGESRRRGLPTNLVYASDARRRMDAAVMGPTVGRMGGLLLLTEGGASAARDAVRAAGMRGMVDRVVVAEPARTRRDR